MTRQVGVMRREPDTWPAVPHIGQSLRMLAAMLGLAGLGSGRGARGVGVGVEQVREAQAQDFAPRGRDAAGARLPARHGRGADRRTKQPGNGAGAAEGVNHAGGLGLGGGDVWDFAHVCTGILTSRSGLPRFGGLGQKIRLA